MTSLALGGATIGSNNLAVTGTTALAGATTVSTGGLTIGVAGTTGGTIALKGSTAGTLTLQVPATVTDYSITLPSAAAAANGYILTSTTAGVTSWTNPTALGVDLDVGTTAITNGTVGRVLYDNNGVLGQYTAVPVAFGGTNATSASITAFNNITGYTASGATGTTSTNLVFSTSPSITTPTFVTSATGPLFIGGTDTTSTLTLRSTSGVGTTGADIIFQTGNNGATEAMRILNSGRVGINTTTPSINAVLTVNGNISVAIPTRNAATSNQIGVWTSDDPASDSRSAITFATTAGASSSNSYIAFSTNNYGVSGGERARIDSSGNLLLGGTAARGTTVGTAHLDIFDGTAPAGTLTNGISLYSSSGDFHFMDATGAAYKVGYRNIPQNAQTSAYVAAIGDVGEHISITTGGVTVNASIFSAGDVFTIYNNSGSSQNITAGSGVTFRLAGTATSGTPRTVAQYGLATVLCVTGGASPVFVLSGAGVA
jgi:hypothetical protein